MVHFKEIKWFT